MNYNFIKKDNNNLLINEPFAKILAFNNIKTANDLWTLEGEAVKKILKQRGTERVFLLSPDGEKIEAYIKRYSKEPKQEIVKKFFSWKFKQFDAVHEWQALIAFHRAGLATMQPMAVATLSNGCSCNLTLGITDYQRAEELFKNFTKNDRKRRLSLINKIGKLAGKMHKLNYAHQDFYLVHMFVREQEDDKVYLIDLQRLVMQKKLASRWKIKDLAQLLFSASNYVSQTDILRFWKVYCQLVGMQNYRKKSFIKKILVKAKKIKDRDLRCAITKKSI